jgi:hypothetical protein
MWRTVQLCTVLCFYSIPFLCSSQEFEWTPFVTEMVIPEVIDNREGGHIEMVMGEHEHFWGGGFNDLVKMYGYARYGSKVTFPGPTILVSKDVAVQITWLNNITAPHILDAYIEQSLMVPPSAC